MFQHWLQRSDLLFACGVLLILMVLIIPLPKWVLDVFLIISLLSSLLILMTSLFIEKPLDFSSFPSILLLSTMMRLSLNVASTRLILGDGHEGVGAAGALIQAFGQFVTGGNFVIGMIVFVILIIVNFVVITKGSGRIAEVSARFSLDAMPGKQMAIDAELSAGLIQEKVAREKRRKLEEETNFFGAMDGAAKFVRGDAIAGLLITMINILGGIIIGVVQQGISFQNACHTYTVLTVGDGLVTQVPALIVSTAAGLLVSKGGATGTTDQALFQQIGSYPKAFGLSSVMLMGLALVPHTPKFFLLFLSVMTAWGGWSLHKKQNETPAQETKDEEPSGSQSDPEIVTVSPPDPIRVGLGYGLLAWLDQGQGRATLTEQIQALRRQMAEDTGFVIPALHIKDQTTLEHDQYCIFIKDIEVGRGNLMIDHHLAMDPMGKPFTMDGVPTKEPTFGLPALWIPKNKKDEAIEKGYTVVDARTVLMTHLSEAIKDAMPELLSFAETQKLLDQLSGEHAKLVGDLIPQQTSVHIVQNVLQRLLDERLSIRDLPTILEGLAEGLTQTRQPILLTEHVRKKLSRTINHAHLNAQGKLPVVRLGAAWETYMMEALVGEGEVKQLGLSPVETQKLVKDIQDIWTQQAAVGESPVLVAPGPLRYSLYRLLERVRPHTVVLAQHEIHPKTPWVSCGFLPGPQDVPTPAKAAGAE